MSEARDPHEPFDDLCAGLALGSLDAGQRQRLDEHRRAGCPRCGSLLAQLSSTAAELAYAADPVAPRPEVKARVLARVRSEAAAARAAEASRAASSGADSRRPRLVMWVAACGWAAALVMAAWAFQLSSESRQARQQLDVERAQLSQLEERVSREKLWGDVLTSRESEIVVMLPTGQGSPELEARVFYDPSTERAVVVIENLEAPADKDFQLWAIKGGVPASLGVLEATEDGYAVLRLAGVGRPDLLNAFAVSLEARGGSRSNLPEGAVVLMGSVSARE